MRFTIRPNTENLAWPTEPDPADLETALKAAKSGREKKEARATALKMTRRRVLANARRNVGCNSDNLDWIAMVSVLRSTYRTDGRFAWIDGSCPALNGTIEIEVTVWSDHHYNYCCPREEKEDAA